MRTDLREFFPVIRSREAVLSEIHEKPFLQETFSSWLPDEQERFLDYCTGVRGMKIIFIMAGLFSIPGCLFQSHFNSI